MVHGSPRLTDSARRRVTAWSVPGPCRRLGSRPIASCNVQPVVRVKASLTQTIGESAAPASVMTTETPVAWIARSRISAIRPLPAPFLTITTADRLPFPADPRRDPVGGGDEG